MKFWQHSEHRVNVELDQHLTIHKWGEDFIRLKLPADKTQHRFYPTQALQPTQARKIRRVVNGQLTPLQASSEYELMRTLPKSTIDGQITIANYIVAEPSLMVFDQMPTDYYLSTDDKGFAQDFNYQNKPYHPSDVPMKTLDKVPVVRIHSPYSISANPYYMDEGLHNIDIQYGHNDNYNLQENWLKAVTQTANRHGIEVKRSAHKLLYKHGDRWVKFESSEMARGVLACYINIDSAYNKAYDFYKPELKKDVRNQFAYGLKQGNPAIGHGFVDEVIKRFAEILGLPIVDKPYFGQELENWKTIEKLHADPAWIKDGYRADANWFYDTGVDGFEHEFDLLKKPNTNIFHFGIEHSGLEFHKQPELTVDEIAQGKYRPPNVIDSYAVYHKTKHNNHYQTGKVAHIYRPIAIDAAGLSYFCDLDITDGDLKITVPQEFLEKATYPVTVDPTFGYAAQGASSLSITAAASYENLLNQTGTVGTLGSISAYMGVSATGSNTVSLVFALYNNSTKARVDYSAENVYPANVATGWLSFLTTQNASTTAIGYDLGIEGSENPSGYTGYTIAYDTVTNAGGSTTSNTYSSPPPSTEPTVVTNNDSFSIFAGTSVPNSDFFKMF